MPPCRSYWILVSAKCRILAARGLHLAVKLFVLLSISLVFLLSCSSDQSSDLADSPGQSSNLTDPPDSSSNLTDAEMLVIAKKTCKVLQGMGYSYSTFTDMVWIYAEYYPEQKAFYEQNRQWADAWDIRLGEDRPEFRDKNVVDAADAFNIVYPGPVAMRNFCNRLP